MVRVFRLLGSRLRVGVAALVAVVAVVAVTACGSDSDDAPAATTATGRPDLSGVTLRVADQVGQLKALLEASGVLADVPYKIEWSDFSAAAPLLQALRAGAADIGQAGDAPILNALGAGAPLKVVGAARTSPKGVAILVPKDSPIRTVADLRGKTVSPSTEGSIGHYLLLGALKEAGLTPDDLTISFLAPPAASAAFDAHQIDAWVTWDPYVALAERKGARIVRDGEGINSGLGFVVATEDAVEDAGTKAAIADFLTRQRNAFIWSNQHQGEFSKIFASLTKLPEPVALDVLRRRQWSAPPIDDQIVSQFQKSADVYAEAGVLEKKLDVKPFFVRSLTS
ncbi:aliphatic sulfonate ABC transporter substrate-binding protein [Frankia sp. CcI49]|uniref:ABC transporter substrate-binding protein n=1 Tax=Frankia sp. CcI49 TaxID=1745382 RepID=UPI0009761D3B|nr:ABC transporter substrate-binding protein [Frankia sp. CcI49]ONH59809.1 aliphatic sulfonate ABC transporter substrate-binding protein [Frankia sp. CcI49]